MTGATRMMNTVRAFEQLADRVGRMTLPKNYRDDMLKLLNYFVRQSQCDLDRRDDFENIRRNFRVFEERAAGTPVIPELKKMEAWGVATAFVKAPLPQAVLIERDIAFEPKRLVSKYLLWSVADLFDHLHAEVKYSEEFADDEWRSVLKGLEFLQEQAELARFARAQSRIRETWTDVKRVLEKHHMLDEYRGEAQLRNRVRFFVYGNLG